MYSGGGRPGCVCYWGCGNPGNKIVWATFTVSALLGAGLSLGGGIGGNSCFKQYQDCVDTVKDDEYCRDQADSSCDLHKYQGLVGSGLVILFIITPLITIYFCCFAQRPGDAQRTTIISAAPLQAPPGYLPYPPPYSVYPGGPPGPYASQAYHAGAYPYPAAGMQMAAFPPAPGDGAGPSHGQPPVLGVPVTMPPGSSFPMPHKG